MVAKVFKIVSVLSAAIFMIPVISSAQNELNAIISENNLYERFTKVSLEYPLLTYEDTTYMAVRDAGKMFGRDVSWNSDEQSITIESNHDKRVIDSDETAMVMGKALLLEHLGYNGECCVSYSYEELYKTELWKISPVTESGTTSMFVLIDAYTGQFGVYNDMNIVVSSL